MCVGAEIDPMKETMNCQKIKEKKKHILYERPFQGKLGGET